MTEESNLYETLCIDIDVAHFHICVDTFVVITHKQIQKIFTGFKPKK